jgi:hypothetical protein
VRDLVRPVVRTYWHWDFYSHYYRDGCNRISLNRSPASARRAPGPEATFAQNTFLRSSLIYRTLSPFLDGFARSLNFWPPFSRGCCSRTICHPYSLAIPKNRARPAVDLLSLLATHLCRNPLSWLSRMRERISAPSEPSRRAALLCFVYNNGGSFWRSTLAMAHKLGRSTVAATLYDLPH